jgi:hypothetical protein
MHCLVIETIVPVHNFCTEYVGYDQIKTVFDPEYVCVENMQGYDRIAHYYLRPGNYNKIANCYFQPGNYDSEVDGSDSGSDESNED